MTGPSPFAVLGLAARLGLPVSTELTDDDVRAAWRRVAAATHPDRADGGDPAAYAAASAAYATLRTPWGRSEALADLSEPAHQSVPAIPPAASVLPWWRLALLLPLRVVRGRP